MTPLTPHQAEILLSWAAITQRDSLNRLRQDCELRLKAAARAELEAALTNQIHYLCDCRTEVRLAQSEQGA